MLLNERSEIIERCLDIVAKAASSKEELEQAMNELMALPYIINSYSFSSFFWCITAHKNCPIEAMEYIVYNYPPPAYLKQKENIARNPSAPPQILEKLLEVGDYHIDMAIAQNPSASRECLAKLLNSNDPDIVEEALNHPSVKNLVSFF